MCCRCRLTMVHDTLRETPRMVLLRRTNAQVLDYLHAENNYSAAVLAPTANLTAALYAEMAGRIPASDVSDPPQRYKGFYYYEYRVPGGQFMVKARWARGQGFATHHPEHGLFMPTSRGHESARRRLLALARQDPSRSLTKQVSARLCSSRRG